MIGSCRQLLGMIEEILTYARTNAPAIDIRPAEFRLRDVVENVREMNASLLERKGLSFTTEYDGEIPEAWADRDKVAHVLGNLIGNAIKFTPEGGWVRVEARPAPGQPGWLQVEVADSGIGIDPRAPRAHLPRVRAGGRLAGAGAPRHGAGAFHRPALRGAARRAHLGGEHSWAREAASSLPFPPSTPPATAGDEPSSNGDGADA